MKIKVTKVVVLTMGVEREELDEKVLRELQVRVCERTITEFDYKILDALLSSVIQDLNNAK